MNISILTDLIALHGYGVYVWPAYIAVLAALLIEPWLIRRRATRARALAREQRCATQFGGDDVAAWRATRLPGEDA